MVTGTTVRDMPAPDFTIRETDSEAERVEIKLLLGSAFDVRPSVGKVFGQLYDDVSGGWEPTSTSIVAVANDQVIGHTLFVPRAFGFDGVEIPGAIVAMVVVAPNWRGSGVGSALMTYTEVLAKRQGLFYLHLAGNRGFYGRMGFVDGYQNCRTSVIMESVRLDGSELHLAGPGDLDALVALSSVGAPPGSVLPGADRWRWVIDTGHPRALVSRIEYLIGILSEDDFLLLDGTQTGGVIRAAGAGEKLVVYEAWSGSGSGGRLLGSVVQFARGRGYRQISLHLPQSNEISLAAAELGGVRECCVDSQLLGKVLDPCGMLERMCPAFSRRLTNSEMSMWTGQIEFRIDDTAVAAAISRGRVTMRPAEERNAQWVISIPGIALTRALLGTDRFVDRAETQIGDDSELRLLLDTLFPLKTPHFWLADSI